MSTQAPEQQAPMPPLTPPSPKREHKAPAPAGGQLWARHSPFAQAVPSGHSAFVEQLPPDPPVHESVSHPDPVPLPGPVAEASPHAPQLSGLELRSTH